MKNIDEIRLETDLNYRFQYLAEFIGFGPDDIKTIHAAGPLLAPLVPSLVDAVYQKLHSYDATWRHFLPRQAGYAGEVPFTMEQLTPDHPQITFRKKRLAHYLTRLVTSPYDGNMISYLNYVGKMHTPSAGSPDIAVPLVQMNALMGFVADAMNATILGFDLSPDVKAAAIRAFSKLLWLQNDLINRHYSN